MLAAGPWNADRPAAPNAETGTRADRDSRHLEAGMALVEVTLD